MGTWKNYIEKLNKELTGKKVTFENTIYTIAKVDYNGIVHIDKKTEFNDTMAVYSTYEARKALVKEV